MKKVLFVLIGIILVGGAYFGMRKNIQPVTSPIPLSEIAPAKNTNQEVSNPMPASGFTPPLDRAKERVTKKPFGILINPKTSPVQPERFQGYHTGTDFEIFPDEADADVPVKAVCDGKLIIKKYASGYGGVAVESCTIENQPVTVVYGHLQLASINYSVNDPVKAGDTLGILGKGYSPETDGERKHLHLAFHRGSAVNILGYVSDQANLDNWLDPCHYVCQ